MTTIAQARRASGTDTIGHSGVQPWSAGMLFPAVIGLVYRNGVKAYAELTLDGITDKVTNWAEAERLARFYLKNPQHRNRRYYYRLADAVAKVYAVDAYGVL